MPVIEFVQNYSDLSTDQGYQFRFHCDHCGNGFMSTFVPNRLEQAGGFLRAASNLLGGVLGRVGDTAYDVQRAIAGPQHDKALRDAVQEVKPLFNQCHRCGRWVCGEICWNGERGLCKQCAPILHEEIASAQATAVRYQAEQKALAVDQTEGADFSVKHAAYCPSCQAPSSGSKFCAECGTPMAAPKTRHCTECGSKLTDGVKFCPDCGTRAG